MSGSRSEGPARTVLDRVFAVGVIVKGLDGTVELAVGLALLLGPGWVDRVLRAIVNTAQSGDSSASTLIATVVGHADASIGAGSTSFLIVFLIAHGVIKLALVYALLRRILKAYPWAIGVLIVFLAYQLCVLATSPSVGQVLFSVLDVAIIVLVWREYRELHRRARSEPDSVQDINCRDSAQVTTRRAIQHRN